MWSSTKKRNKKETFITISSLYLRANLVYSKDYLGRPTNMLFKEAESLSILFHFKKGKKGSDVVYGTCPLVAVIDEGSKNLSDNSCNLGFLFTDVQNLIVYNNLESNLDRVSFNNHSGVAVKIQVMIEYNYSVSDIVGMATTARIVGGRAEGSGFCVGGVPSRVLA